ncbi:ATP-binding protein [Nocardia amamiensis]|uniref:ATP-binding protein n=1 Tax=Nocardia amamiensis TaxID=404578 RepID=UPI00082C2383|nr:ATP-binding protein [Nocardia amamiensis]
MAPAEQRKSDAVSAAELVVERLRLLLDAHLDPDGEHAERLAPVEARLAGPEGAFRQRLGDLFGLTEGEIDALDLAVAVAVEPALAAEVAQVQGMPSRYLPGEIALRLLLGHSPSPVVRSGSPLLSWGFVEVVQFAPDEPALFRADPAVVDWYFGTLSASAIPVRRAPDVEPLPEWRVADHARRIEGILAEQKPVRLVLVGRRGTGRASLAAAIAKHLGRQAICVDPESLTHGAGYSTFLRLQRLALLGDLVLVWRGAPASWPAALPVAMLQAVTLEPGESLAPVDGIVDLDIPMPLLGKDTLGALYRSYLPAVADQLDVVVGQPRVGDLADAAAQQITTPEDLRRFLRQRNSARTAQIGRVERVSYTWDDLVLADQTKTMLQAFEAEARSRATLLADEKRRRLFGDTAQLSALFSGPPGLGKSMSAKVIAHELGLDLLVVDSAAITSKFIGETAKNLSLAFEVARDAQCALMFEEADSFFTTRVKVETANDRHSNADIGHLLQLMENHDGLVMLSSNRRSNIDAAFTRRLRFIVEFRPPTQAEREQLWERALAALGMAEPMRQAVVPAVAAAHELTPAQIKGAALTAAYRAGDTGITGAEVEQAARLELQKEGRLISAVPETPVPARKAIAHG